MPFMSEKSPARGVAKGPLRRLALAGAVMAACLGFGAEALASSAPFPDAQEKARIDRLIVVYSKRYNVPVALARKVVQSESEYRALARNGPYWGLMQIRYDTAQGMGYKGSAKGLLDAETNLAYGIAYLSNALTAANGNMSRGHMLYRTGYYYEAKRRRVLDEMITVRDFKPVGAEAPVLAMADVQDATGALWSGQTGQDEPKTASAAIASAIAAPMPRPKPLIAQPESAVAAAPAAGPVVAAAASTAPAVAQPTVVYASVLPLSKPALLRANALAPTPIVPSELSTPEAVAVSADAAPLPRPKPVPAADADPTDPPQTPLQIALNAAAAKRGAELAAETEVVAAPGMPLPRQRPDAAAAEVAPVVIADHVAAPMPRIRPVLVGTIGAE